MRSDDFDYVLPPEQIAQRPARRREDARMLVVEPGEANLVDRRAEQLAAELETWDGPAPLVVRNDSRVVPARVQAERDDGRSFELLLCEPAPGLSPGARVRAWVRGARKLQPGDGLGFGEVRLRYVAPDTVDTRARWFELERGDPFNALSETGQIPLPPYIRRAAGPTAEDRERYQTAYATRPGSVAAPTAGLHWRADLGIETVDITLHVGPGTFLPMDVEEVGDHRVGSERVIVSEEASSRIEDARAAGRPILGVGTTVARALETVAAAHSGRVVPWSGSTELVITPAHRWQVVDHLLTNFHLPRSSLLMLVCSFGGRERILGAYREAVERGYRFYSYGDCMLVHGRGMPDAS